MIADEHLLFAILAATIFLFVRGRWRHDMVAMAALLACVAGGLVPADGAFAGFGHPAVVTVACVLILSRGLLASGAVDALAQRVLPSTAGPGVTIAALTGLAALLSAFMNNVGALALLMPVAIQLAGRLEMPPGRLLMPLAFGSILGGMTSLIGTPPNLIVSAFRSQNGANSFAMFDFTPVGGAIALAGVLFVTLGGWRLVPLRERKGAEGFETGTYLTEARLPSKSKAVGKTLREVEAALDEADAQVIGLIRDEVRIPAPHPSRTLHAGDILVIEAEPESLASALASLGLKLEEDVKRDAAAKAEAASAEVRSGDASVRSRTDADDAKAGDDGKESQEEDDAKEARSAGVATEAAGVRSSGDSGSAEEEAAQSEAPEAKSAVASDEIALAEMALLPDSVLAGRSATDLRLRTRFGINLLAVSRQGRRSMSRLRATRLAAGDVVLLQGAPEVLADFAAEHGCVPLAPRALRLPHPRTAAVAGGVMLASIVGAAFGLLPAAISFAAGVLVLMATRIVPPRTAYEAVDWPVIVLLGAMIPVAGAMVTTGAADTIAHLLLEGVAQGHPVLALALVMVLTMTLSDFMNNAATAAVMCPIAVGTATALGASPDAFLMAVAIGASCAFLTPIGHQNNTLILGPGGFAFGDYWRLGLPLEILVVAVGLPVLLVVWPL